MTVFRPAFYLSGVAISVAFLILSSDAHAAGTYADCRMNGGTEMCTQPIPSKWRYANGRALPQAGYGLPQFCYDASFDAMVSDTPNEAYDKFIAIFTAQFIEQCYVDITQPFVRYEDCDVKPQSVQTFGARHTGSPSTSPFNGRAIIESAQCNVRAPSYTYPGEYYVAYPSYRQLRCAIGIPATSPDGKVFCIGARSNDEKDLEEDGDPGCDGKGNPIDAATGNKFQADVDFSDAKGRLKLIRYYNSRALKSGSFGALWAHNFDSRLSFEDGGAQLWVVAHRADGAGLSFKPIGSDYQANSADVRDRLSAIRDGSNNITGWRLYDADAQTQELYDGRGRLTKIVYSDGYFQDVLYASASSRSASSVVDSYGRTIVFHFGVAGVDDLAAVVKVTLPSNREIRYQYNANAFEQAAVLMTVQHANDTSFSYVYDLSNRLVGIDDQLGVRYATYGYDVGGRAISSEHAGGAVGVYVTPTVNESSGSVSNVISDMGVTITQNYARINGKLKLTSQSQPAGSGCAASTSARGYDSNGFLKSEDDFNGNRACYLSNSRGLTTVKVEGLAGGANCDSFLTQGSSLPSTARKFTSDWHPTWSQPTRVAAPGRLITYVFNGQPDPTVGNAIANCASGAAPLPGGEPISVLCKRVERATTDPTGSQGLSATVDSSVSAIVESFTYSTDGQILTSTDAVGNVTRYEYYAATAGAVTRGDLQRVITPKGFTTVFESYNRNGDVARTVDPNGLTTVVTFDALDRIESMNVGGEISTVIRDERGLIRKIINANGAELNMTYDDAHRLIGISDKVGNSVTYTLNVAGDRMKEEYKDSGGQLKRQIDRTFDALNRLHRLKG